ncbi:MAG: circularly permuted type 2 ATP-grasp protein, partial [Actinomycetota bacterium]
MFWPSEYTVDELLDDQGQPRDVAAALYRFFDGIGIDELRERQRSCELEILTMGISFTVYSDGQNIDRSW